MTNKRSVAKVGKALEKGLSCCIDNLSSIKRVLNAIDALVIEGFGADVRSQCALPKNAEWAPDVFGFSVYASGENAFEVNWPHFCLAQTHIVLSGNVTYAGLPSDRIPGHNYQEKRKTVMTMDVDEIKRCIVDTGGFLCKFNDGLTSAGECGIILPSGYMILTASHNARVLRWSLVADDQDKARVKETLRNVLADFAEFRNPNLGYIQFASYMGLDI